jgi:dTDP-4-amino-4,6-dideoxygalactose transaminase
MLPEWVVPLSELSFTEDEICDVARVLRSGWWTSGHETAQLEREFARYIGTSHAIAVSNGTAALQLAFLSLQLRDGEEVVTPSFTFAAVANTLLNVRAVPRFADVSSLSAPIVSAETIEQAITTNTRGLCVMHYGGFPCDMDSIMELARERNLWVVEDAAHAPGAAWNGVRCGAWGDVGCFSFFGNKNLTCGEGGMITTNNDDLAKRIRLLRSHGMSSLTWDRYNGHSFSYDISIPGLNCRMDDIRAALARTQLRSLDKWNRLRSERVEWYRSFLGEDPRWTRLFDNHSGSSAHHLFAVVLDESISRSSVMSFMKSKGIQTSIHYPPIHQFSCYRQMSFVPHSLKFTDMLGQRILTLPLFPSMTVAQTKAACDVFHEAVAAGSDPHA